MTKIIGDRTVHYIVPVHNNMVKPVYVKKARKQFQITPADGVSDREFAKI